MGVATCTQIASCSCNSPLGLQLGNLPLRVAFSVPRGVFPANSPLGVAICYIIHAKDVEKSPLL